MRVLRTPLSIKAARIAMARKGQPARRPGAALAAIGMGSIEIFFPMSAARRVATSPIARRPSSVKSALSAAKTMRQSRAPAASAFGVCASTRTAGPPPPPCRRLRRAGHRRFGRHRFSDHRFRHHRFFRVRLFGRGFDRCRRHRRRFFEAAVGALIMGVLATGLRIGVWVTGGRGAAWAGTRTTRRSRVGGCGTGMRRAVLDRPAAGGKRRASRKLGVATPPGVGGRGRHGRPRRQQNGANWAPGPDDLIPPGQLPPSLYPSRR